MDTNEELQRDIAWLESWVDAHPTTRASKRIEAVLAVVKTVGGENVPLEEGVPLRTTAEKYTHLAGLVESWVPPQSVWAKNTHESEEMILNFVQHLYHSHTLGCEECFGGSDRI